MKDYYTLSEVLLGLRKEQIRILKELQYLERMLDSYGSIVHQNSGFSLNLRLYQRKLCYTLNLSYSLCDKISNSIFNGHNLFDFDFVKVFLERDDRGNYFLPNVDVKVLKDKQVEFNQKVDSILNDSFVLDTSIDAGINKIENFKYDISSSAYLSQTNYLKGIGNLEGFLYYVRNNDMSWYFKNADINKNLYDIINKMLDIKISRDSFSEYIQNVIDNSNDAKKHIVVPNDKISDYKLDFTLVDRHDAFVLVKK